METRTFRGRDLASALVALRQAYGEDAIVLRTRGPAEIGGDGYEVDALPAGAEAQARRATRAADRVKRPSVIALVGPPGGGKTTTIVKLALHRAAFGGLRVGLLTLDTYRAAGVEQLHVYAEIAELPLEVAYQSADVEGALERLADCDVVLVDTPGRGMRGMTDVEWRGLLARTAPEQVHLVLAAGLRIDVARAAMDAHRWCGTTHVLLTRLDEVPGRTGINELRDALGLPMRWTCDGPEVPHDLRAITRAPGAAAYANLAG